MKRCIKMVGLGRSSSYPLFFLFLKNYLCALCGEFCLKFLNPHSLGRLDGENGHTRSEFPVPFHGLLV
jgi:hypothetical protein